MVGNVSGPGQTPEKQESFKEGLKTFAFGVLKLIATGAAIALFGYIMATHGPR